jgi:mannose-6-phosphate isomerase-like protein (cupin superfamily)
VSAAFGSARPAVAYDVLAPDRSEIRLLPQTSGGSMVHCTLPPGAVSLAVTHRTVDELWYVLSGRGELWRRQGEREEVVTLEAGSAHSLPLGTWFQFRNPGLEPLVIVIVTMPPWPGMDEAVRVPDRWPQPSGDGGPPAA